MMVHFGNRHTVLANLMRHLHDAVFHDNVSPKDAERFLLQIGRLCNRLKLTGIIQSCSAISNVLALGAMIAAYFDEPMIASNLLLGSILLMMGLMLLFTGKIQIANQALDVHLSNLETYRQWEQYLKLKRCRITAAKTSTNPQEPTHVRSSHYHRNRPGHH